MNNLEKLGFENWFKDKIELSKTPDSQIARVISVNKNSFVVSNGTSWALWSYRDIRGNLSTVQLCQPGKDPALS